MKKDERAVCLTASEFLAVGRNGLNQQVANARWQLILAAQRNVPEVFEALRDEVYPAFEQLAQPGWGMGASSARLKGSFSRCDQNPGDDRLGSRPTTEVA
jgi:hypothetical protein